MIWMQPYGLAAIAALVVILFGGTYLKGRMDGREVCNDRISVIMADAAARVMEEQSRGMEAAAKLEEANVARKTHFRTITKTVERVVEKPVYRNVCFDDDGMRLANAALAGAAATPAKPPHPLPGTATPR